MKQNKIDKIIFWVADMAGYLIPSILIISFLYAIFIFIVLVPSNNDYNTACEKLNMEYVRTSGTDFCVDTNNNAHYTDFKCHNEGFLHLDMDCTARLINIQP